MNIDLKPCPFCGGTVKKFTGLYNGEFWDRESDPVITHWMSLPELPKEDEKQ